MVSLSVIYFTWNSTLVYIYNFCLVWNLVIITTIMAATQACTLVTTLASTQVNSSTLVNSSKCIMATSQSCTMVATYSITRPRGVKDEKQQFLGKIH
jgi:hypothetical protein